MNRRMDFIMDVKRNSGIDLLRILSMLGIIGLHVVNQGGIINNLSLYSAKYYIVLFMLAILYASVNIFAIMTGYLSVNKRQNKNTRIVELISIMIFWSLVITGIFYIFNLYNIRSQGIKDLIGCLFPFIVGRYWYITCYVLVFFMMPYINTFINNINKDVFKKMLIILFVLFTVIPNIIHSDLFVINNGYSPFWLIFCYMIGAYIRLYKNDYKTKLYKIAAPILLAYIFNIVVKIILLKAFNKESDSNWFINYISPFIVWFSTEVFILFKGIGVKSEKISAIIKQISISSFSVYIIHCHKVIFDYINKDLFMFLNNYNGFVIIGGIIIAIFTTYLTCMIIDQIRLIIFKLFGINKLINFIGDKMDKILN